MSNSGPLSAVQTDDPVITLSLGGGTMSLCLLVSGYSAPTRGEEFEMSVERNRSYLILESSGLLLEPCCFEVVDDVCDTPVGRVWQLTVLHGTVGGNWGGRKRTSS